uniref:LRRCT domain-containing protein n=1 Tax=Crocodylus porosus TaxID=8502 RepID=A0A7M4FSR8_CROPO
APPAALPAGSSAIARGGFRNLSRLELASNGIVYLPPGLFSGLAGLRHLDLRNNSLVDIKSTTFAGLDLERLDLTANALKTLRAEALAELGRQPRLQLFLRDNPFVCSCDIEDLAGWLNRSRQAADAEQLTCAFPQALQNTSLLALAGAQLGCHSSPHGERALQTSYALLGAVLGLLGVAFLFVLYLNRRGLKGWVSGTRGACRSLLEERRYRYEMRAESRAARVSALAM